MAVAMAVAVAVVTVLQGIPALKVIIVGLIQGMKSVVYIVMLLFLVICKSARRAHPHPPSQSQTLSDL